MALRAPEFEAIEAGDARASADAIRAIWGLVTDNVNRLGLVDALATRLPLHERSVDPPTPLEGNLVSWLSDGTDTGDDGDWKVFISAAGSTKTATVIDFSTIGGLVVSVTSKTANYTATSGDAVILCDASGGAFTITLPAVADETGQTYYVKKTDSSANAVTIDGASAETIDDGTTAVIRSQYESLRITNDGSEWWIQ